MEGISVMNAVTDIHEISQNSLNHKLSINQLKAIGLLITGRTCTRVAVDLGVSRETVSRWKKNPHFIAEMNREQGEMLLAARNRLQQMLTKAIDVIENNLDNGNLKAATEVLKIVNVYAETPITNPELIMHQQAEAMAIEEMNKLPFNKVSTNNDFLKGLANDFAIMIREKYDIEDVEMAELEDMDRSI